MPESQHLVIHRDERRTERAVLWRVPSSAAVGGDAAPLVGESGSVVAAQQFHAQSDALMPLPGDDSDVPGEERGLEDILLVAVVVDVALEELQKKMFEVAIRTHLFIELISF